MSLRLDGRPIGMKYVILANNGSFGFKMAYDDSLWRHSPGVLLELEHLRRLFESPRLEWSDTCAEQGHEMLESVSRERRVIRRSLLSDGSRAGDLWVSVVPFLRWIKHQFTPDTKSGGRTPAPVKNQTRMTTSGYGAPTSAFPAAARGEAGTAASVTVRQVEGGQLSG